jgi:MFS family permease
MAKSALTRWLERTPAAAFNTYAIVAAFGAYFCMYGFRKPFSVGLFDSGVDLFGLTVSEKSVLIVAQAFGYMLSKFLGIKVVSELAATRRAIAIIVFIALAEISLLFFAVTPTPWRALLLFANGLPLGMIWGLVFGFLEGRRSSELLGAGLSASFIVASGAVKSVGKALMGAGVSEDWMPFATGLVFFVPLLLFVYLLRALPPPTAEDEALRVRRAPMDGKARVRFFVALWPGLVSLTFLYMLLTAYRDFRDNFAREIWDAIGYEDTPSIFTVSEIVVAFAVLVPLALVMRVRDNRRALFVIHALILAGVVLVGASTLLFSAGLLDPAAWMILVGIGLYLGYVPFNCILFDRLVASVGIVATAGFLIYVADAFGYLGSVALLSYKELAEPELSWLEFFTTMSYVTAIVCAIALAGSLYYFKRRSSPPAKRD